MDTLPSGPLWTPQEVADLFKVSRFTVYKWAAAGRLGDVVKPAGTEGTQRYRREAVEALLRGETAA